MYHHRYKIALGPAPRKTALGRGQQGSGAAGTPVEGARSSVLTEPPWGGLLRVTVRISRPHQVSSEIWLGWQRDSRSRAKNSGNVMITVTTSFMTLGVSLGSSGPC